MALPDRDSKNSEIGRYLSNPWTSWSRDGKFIVFTSREEGTGWDIWVLPLNGGRGPWSGTPAVEIEPQLSPDGRWLAYTSDESGQLEVYVRPFRGNGGVVDL